MAKIKIIIVDDHNLYRTGLKLNLRDVNAFEVIAEAVNGQVLLDQLAEGILPDVILMDINMPILGGVEATRLVKKEYINIKILALSMHDNESIILNFKRAGGDGYLLKDITVEELTSVITKIVTGINFFLLSSSIYFTDKLRNL